MMAAVSTTPNLRTSSSEGRSWQNPNTTRPSLRPSEIGNDVVAQQRLKPNAREVNSRYRSTSSSFSSSSATNSSYLSSRRSPSPIASRILSTRSSSPRETPLRSSFVNRRPQSAERRRPLTPTPVKGAQISSAAKVLMSSKRNLSLSFQGESLLTPISKTKPATERRTITPTSRELRINPSPARSRQVNTVKAMSKSVDFGSDNKKLIGTSAKVIRSLKPSLTHTIDQVLVDDKLQHLMSKNGINDDVSCNSLNLTNLSITDNGTMSQIKAGSQGVIVPVRVWELTKRQISSSVKATISPVNPTIRRVSPLRAAVRPVEKTSPSRSMVSPIRSRNGVVGTSGSIMCSAPSLLCFAADVQRGKLGKNISDAHLLRLLYNRNLQWRFANSRVESTTYFQTLNAERNLYNTWKAISDLRLSICNRRLEFSRLSLKVKLFSILKKQMMYLQKWAIMEKDYISSLMHATESFGATTVQLPFIYGATADILGLKSAICSAVDVLLAMASSICSLMSEVEKINCLLNEVVSVATNERELLDECKHLVSSIASIQVKDCSMRAHISQLKRASMHIEA